MVCLAVNTFDPNILELRKEKELSNLLLLLIKGAFQKYSAYLDSHIYETSAKENEEILSKSHKYITYCVLLSCIYTYLVYAFLVVIIS